MMIRFENINLKYNQKNIFKDFSLEIGKGEKVVLFGKSGIGKSSLFALILGFVRADSGKVFFDSAPIEEKSVWGVRRKIAFIDQDVSLGSGKVSSLLDFVSGLKANAVLDFGNDKRRELFDLFELEYDTLDKDISQLSGGERQRLAIIISLLLGRKIFLLDEVTSSLDKHLKEKTADFFIRDKSWTVLVISHDAVWLEHHLAKVFDLGEAKWIR